MMGGAGGGGFGRGLTASSSFWGFGGRGFPTNATSRSAEGSGDDADKLELSTERGFRFPYKAGLTSGSLVLLGDTLAQFYGRYQRSKALPKLQPGVERNDWSFVMDGDFWQHDWKRAARMGSYGLLCYGPLSYKWYNFLDRVMPGKNLTNFLTKVVLNQVVLGPIVITIVFAWNAWWTDRLAELPGQYRRQALPTLMDGWKFWTPVTFVNFGLLPLEARVAFMSACAVCWNFYLSTAVTKKPTAAVTNS